MLTLSTADSNSTFLSKMFLSVTSDNLNMCISQFSELSEESNT